MSQPLILIVEDEAIVAMGLRLHLQDLGYVGYARPARVRRRRT